MSSDLRNVLIASACGAAFIAVAFLAPSHRPTSVASAPTAPRQETAGAEPAPSATVEDLTTPLGPLPELDKFAFDCADFPAAAKPRCGAQVPGEQALLDLTEVYRPTRAPTYTPELADRTDAALRAAERLDPALLSPLKRAALQNAALWVFSQCSRFGQEPRAAAAAKAARALTKRFRVSKAELAALPGSATSASAWLGPLDKWTRGAAPRLFHTVADETARTHRSLSNASAFADVVRLVLLDETEQPILSDVVQRITMRRTEGKAVKVCIAELDPSAESCAGPGALVVVDAERGEHIAINPLVPPGCSGCHVNNTPRSNFGATLGAGFDDPAADSRLKQSLLQALRAAH